jgi:drug/metabolite transporter (DMT)-like permease
MMKGLICGFMAASSAGITLDLIKVLLFYTDITPFELIYQRSLIACLIVVAVLHYRGESPFALNRDVALYAFIRILGSFMGFVLQIFSIEFISVSKTVLIINNPFLTSIISFLLIGERSTRHDMICFLLCTVGVIMLTDPFKDTPLHKLDLQNLIGVSLSFLSSLSYNISYVALRKLS